MNSEKSLRGLQDNLRVYTSLHISMCAPKPCKNIYRYPCKAHKLGLTQTGLGSRSPGSSEITRYMSNSDYN